MARSIESAAGSVDFDYGDNMKKARARVWRMEQLLGATSRGRRRSETFINHTFFKGFLCDSSNTKRYDMASAGEEQEWDLNEQYHSWGTSIYFS
jgi:hypothetical protein